MELPKANSDAPPITNNNHFVVRHRNIRNELLRQTDYLMFPDVYDKLTDTQKQEVLTYRQQLRDYINTHKDNFLNGVYNTYEFPTCPTWLNIKPPKY